MRIKSAISFFCISLIFFVYAQAEEMTKTTTQQLIQRAKDFNNKTVIIRGEVIGDVMRRGDFVWFNVRDDFNAIGVWAPKNLVSVIEETGDYQHKGDIVEVEGKFLRSDLQLKGELCIRAQRISLLKRGYHIFHVLRPAKEDVALTLSVIAFFLVVITAVMVRKRAK